MDKHIPKSFILSDEGKKAMANAVTNSHLWEKNPLINRMDFTAVLVFFSVIPKIFALACVTFLAGKNRFAAL
jgi:hypothetical protein